MVLARTSGHFRLLSTSLSVGLLWSRQGPSAMKMGPGSLPISRRLANLTATEEGLAQHLTCSV